MNRKQIVSFIVRLAAAVAVACAVTAADYPRVILAQHPAAYYRLDDAVGSAAARDLTLAHSNGTYNSGTGPTGAPIVATASQAGISTNSAVFIGGVDSPTITIPYSTAISPVNADGITGAPFSCECWVRPGITTAASPMSVLSIAGVATGGNYPNGSGWEFSEVGNPAMWRLTMRSQSGTADLPGSTALTAGQWNHLAVIWDGTTATFFVNGAAQVSKSVSGYLAVPNFAGTVGAGPNTGGGAFQGVVAEVVFYTNAVSPITVSNHFALGSAILSARGATAAASTTSP